MPTSLSDWGLLSDAVDHDINGGGAGKPTYTFTGTAPTVVFRGGSAEYGIINAYTREYVFPEKHLSGTA